MGKTSVPMPTNSRPESMNGLSIAILVSTFLIGCTAQSEYESSAREMLRDEFPQSHYGFIKSWKPIGKNYEYTLSENELEKSTIDVTSCIKYLSSKYPTPPKEILRSFQIVECMKTKGWYLETEEIIITR